MRFDKKTGEGLCTLGLYTLEGVRVLEPEGWSAPRSVVVQAGKIMELRPCGAVSGALVRAEGCFLLPGLIDLHGDGFEYHLTPRAGVSCPIDLAMMANDMALASAGITSFFYSLTDSFEPGLRSREMLRRIITVLEERRSDMKAGVFFHIRHEQANTQGHAELLDWIRSGRIDLLSLNNHLPSPGDERAFNSYLTSFKRRVAAEPEVAAHMVREAQQGLSDGARQSQELAALCAERGLTLASHDDSCAEDFDLACTRGVQIAEFPMTLDLALRFRARGVHVLMGAPNVVRGGSHVCGTSAREAIAAGAVDLLCSDYHYPSLYRAPFLLAERGLLELPQAWQLVSTNPAAAVGLERRKGCIAPDMDADLLLLSNLTGLAGDIRAVIRGGRFVLSSF